MGEVSWADTVQLLTEKLSPDNLPYQVSRCRSVEERVSRVLNNISVNKRISGWLSNSGETKYLKNATISDKVREQGNVKFRAGDNTAALKLYTESVICAPPGPALGLALANRSAALYHLGEHQLSSQDIVMALNNHYPRNLEYKLHLRHAQCCIRLGQYNLVQQLLEKCRNALEIAKLQDNKKTGVNKDITALNSEVTRLQQTKKDQTVTDETEEVDDKFEENSEMPGASDKLRLESSSDSSRGRFIRVKDDISAGEIVFRESPYSCVLLPPFYSSHCHHCLAQLQSPVACVVCTQSRYCSVKCRDESWSQYHKLECGNLDILHSVGLGHLALRSAVMAGKDHLLNIKSLVKTGEYKQSSTDPYSRVFHLQHHLDKLPLDEQFQYVLTAGLLVTLLLKKTSFFNPEREIQGLPGKLKPLQPGSKACDDDVDYVGGLILRHLVQLVSNAHAVTELLEDEEGGVEQVRLGTGVYPAVSMMNHSCLPLIVNNFSGNCLTVRVLRSVVAGDELTNCYGPHYRRHGYPERQRMLREQYMFRCVCRACSDPVERDYLQRFTAAKCQRCGTAVVEQCCGEKSVIPDQRTHSSLLESCHDATGLRELERSWSKILFKHHQLLAALRDKLAKAELENGNVRECVKLLDQGLEYTEARYGADSVEMGHELLKFSDILMIQLEHGDTGANIVDQLCNILQKSYTIFSLQYGAQSKLCQEISEKLKYIKM